MRTTGRYVRTVLPRWHDAFFLLLCVALLSRQLFLPGFIGMADNGDFPKVAGRACLAGADHHTEEFRYFQPNYVRGPSSCYNARLPSSEIVPARMAAWFVRARGDKQHFDIRWLGALHALIFTAVYYLVLVLLRPLPLVLRSALALVALWIFADVGFVAYLNTFYTDVAAMLGGLAAIFLAILLARGSSVSPTLLTLFGLAALFFVTSKAQHAIYGFVPIAALLWFGRRGRPCRTIAILMAIALATAMILMIHSTPDWYAVQSRFNLIFYKIAATSKRPVQDLRELGLEADDARYSGMHAFMPNTPLIDPKFRDRFVASTSYSKVAAFLMRHPSRVIQILRSDLCIEAPQRRLYSNFPKSYGRPPYAQTERFAMWSSLRIWLFHLWPAHIVLWYALLFAGAPWLAIREKSPFRRALWWTVLAVAAVGAGEYCVASLMDACETARHLWMFHVFTDVTVFLALLAVATPAMTPNPVTITR